MQEPSNSILILFVVNVGKINCLVLCFVGNGGLKKKKPGPKKIIKYGVPRILSPEFFKKQKVVVKRVGKKIVIADWKG